MLEFFRKHKGAFLMTLTVIIIISFSVWGGWRKNRDAFSMRQETAFTIYGKDYTVAEAQHFQRLTEPMRMLQMFELYMGLMSLARGQDMGGMDMIYNMVVLQHEMKKAGIHPSDSEADEELKKLPALQENGTFSLQRAQMVEANLGMYGLTPDDLREVARLQIGLNTLKNLVAKNYVPSPLEIEKSYANQYQTIQLSTIQFKLDDFKKDVKVSDDEIKKYFEENKDQYQTAEKRAVSYVLFEEPKDLEKLPLEERQKKQKAVVDSVVAFQNKAMQGGANLDKVAAEEKAQVKSAAAFSRAEAPEPFKSEKDLLEAVFRFNGTPGTPSDPVKGTKGGYYFFTVTKIDEPKPQEIAAVKDKIKDTLTKQKAQEAMTKAVNDARKALADGLKAGKKIDDLAKAQKLTLTPKIDFDSSAPPNDVPKAYEVNKAAQETTPGELTSVVETDTGALLAYVYAKELRKRDDSASLRKNIEDTTSSMARDRLFSAWFTQKRDDAKISTPTSKT